jgi:heme exporter protein B
MFTLLLHDIRYYLSNLKEAAYLYIYFISMIALFVFGLSAQGSKDYAAAILWVTLISALLLASPLLFQRDEEEGRLDYLRLLPISLELVVVARYLACYLVFVLPILALIPPAGLLLQVPPSVWGQVVVLLALGGALVLAVIVMASAMMTGLSHHSGLIGLMVLPLLVPLVIFGVSALDAIISTTMAAEGSPLVLLGALAFFFLPLALLVSASCLRVTSDE